MYKLYVIQANKYHKLPMLDELTLSYNTAYAQTQNINSNWSIKLPASKQISCTMRFIYYYQRKNPIHQQLRQASFKPLALTCLLELPNADSVEGDFVVEKYSSYIEESNLEVIKMELVNIGTINFGNILEKG